MTETAVVRVVLGYSSLTALGTEKTWKKSAHFLEKICYQPFKITIKVQIPLDTCAVKPELLSLCCITSDMTCESTLVVSSGLVAAGRDDTQVLAYYAYDGLGLVLEKILFIGSRN